MRTNVPILLVICLLWSGTLQADVHLVPSLRLWQYYNDNIFRTETDTTEDTITVVQPTLGLVQRDITSKQTFSYSPSLEVFWRTKNQNSLSHVASYLGEFERSPRLRFKAAERAEYSLAASTQLFPESAVEVQQVRMRTFRNAAEFTPKYSLTERTDVSLKSEFLVAVYREDTALTPVSDINLVDTYQWSETGVVDFKITEHDTLSPSANYRMFWFVGAPDTAAISALFNWERFWSESLVTNAGAGIAEIIRGAFDSSVTDFVASASIEQRSAEGSVRAAYERNVTASGGLGTALVEDSVSIGLSWNFESDWGYGLEGGYYYATSTNSAYRLRGFYGESSIRKGIGARAQIALGYNYRTQDVRAGNVPDFARNQAFIMFTIASAPTEQESTPTEGETSSGANER
jgi:hypothetical protein